MENWLKKIKAPRWSVKLFFARLRYGFPARRLKIVGVTGTNGKTTTVTLLHQIANQLGYKSGLIGTVEILIGEEKFKTDSDKPMPITTPDSVFLTKIFSRMVQAGCQYVFMEVSSHAMDQNRVAGIDFTGGIFTNLTHDHLDYHKNFENYFIAKKKFFAMLSTASFALSNTDDEYGARMLEGIRAKKYSYGVNGQKDFLGETEKIDFNGLHLSVNQEKISSQLLGKFNAYNLLAVWSACKLLGFDMTKVKKILENIKPPRGRFEHFTSKNGVLVIVDYAHSPDALEKILSAVWEIKTTTGKVISVFGCGGDKDPFKRPVMGKIGVVLSDVAIFTSDNPRSEDPDKIIEAMQKDLSVEELKKVKAIANRREAIQEAVKIAQAGDIILCAGKGHEDYQEIKGVKSHFDDMEEFQKTYDQL